METRGYDSISSSQHLISVIHPSSPLIIIKKDVPMIGDTGLSIEPSRYICGKGTYLKYIVYLFARCEILLRVVRKANEWIG